jgi:outer membrane autotransporter protein
LHLLKAIPILGWLPRAWTAFFQPSEVSIMVHRIPFRFVAPLVMGLLPAAVLAQTEPRGFYVTGYAQVSRIGSSTFAESGALGAGSGLAAEFGSGRGLGGDIGYRYGNGWAAEVEWNYRSHKLSSLRQGGGTLARDGDFASNILLINGLRRFISASPWTPYVGAGIGWVQEIDVDIKPAAGGVERSYSASSKVAVQLIAGVEYAITQNWRLTADARWLRVGSVQLDNETGNSGGSLRSLNYNPFSVQVGVRYSF